MTNNYMDKQPWKCNARQEKRGPINNLCNGTIQPPTSVNLRHFNIKSKTVKCPDCLTQASFISWAPTSFESGEKRKVWSCLKEIKSSEASDVKPSTTEQHKVKTPSCVKQPDINLGHMSLRSVFWSSEEGTRWSEVQRVIKKELE